MSVSREDKGNHSCVVLQEGQSQDELVTVGEVSGTKGGPEGVTTDIGAGYTWG
jgi:hypothetical protein